MPVMWKWDWDFVQHDEVQFEELKICSDCHPGHPPGIDTDEAFIAGREAFKSEDSDKCHAYRRNQTLFDAFWHGWNWQRYRLNPHEEPLDSEI